MSSPLTSDRLARSPSIGRQLVDLTLIQLTNWRWSWRQQIFLGTLLPVASMWLLGTVADDSPGSTGSEYIFVGAILMSVVVQNQNLVAANFAYMKASGMETYFRTLPIAPTLLPIATFLSFFALSLPATLLALLAGPAILGIDTTFRWPAAVIFILAAAFVGYVGSLIALWTRTPPEASNLSFIVSLLLVGSGAIFFPREELPSWMLLISRLNPLFYAARGLRSSLLETWERSSVAVDIGVLALSALLLGLAVHLTVRHHSE